MSSWIYETNTEYFSYGLYLVNSQLGWMFSGRIRKKQYEDKEVMMLVNEDNGNDISEFGNLETVSLKNIEADSSFGNTLLKVGDGYRVSMWPWKVSKYELPSNYNLLFIIYLLIGLFIHHQCLKSFGEICSLKNVSVFLDTVLMKAQ